MITLTKAAIIARLEDRNLQVVADRLHVTRSYLHAIRSGKAPLSERMHMLLSEYLTNGLGGDNDQSV